jgi:hypothetical protein
MSLFLKDATVVVQNAVAVAVVASSIAPVFALAPVSAIAALMSWAASLKTKPFNLGSSLKDNTQTQFPIAVSSLSLSLSSEAPITNPAPVVD